MALGRLGLSADTLSPFQRIVDLLLILLAHALALVLTGPALTAQLDFALLFVVVTFTVVTTVFPVYASRYKEHLAGEIGPALLAWVVTALALDGLLWIQGTTLAASFALSVTWPAIAALLLCMWRVLERPVVRGLGSRSRPHHHTAAILGATTSGYELCREVEQRPWLRLRMVGVYDDRAADRRQPLWPGVCFLGGTQDLLTACASGTVDTVYIALPLGADERIHRLRNKLLQTGATVFLIADLLPAYASLAARWTTLGASPVLSVHDTPIRGFSAVLKRLEDIAGGILAMLILIVPMAVIAAAVKLTSRGPILFRQRRYGLNGEAIRVLKFRTMSVCEDGDVVRQAQRGDARVTKVGRLLRRTSLDELPQFFQVLTGEMSMVGPRPHAVAHNEQYRALIPQYMLRHKVKPGITGWAQVNGWRGETPTVAWMQKRVEHDLEYINNWSFFFDVKIVILTIFGRASRHNAF